MSTTVSARRAGEKFPDLLRQVEQGDTIAISRRDETVAFLISRARLEALVETVEILRHADAMEAIERHSAGTSRMHPLSALDDDAR